MSAEPLEEGQGCAHDYSRADDRSLCEVLDKVGNAVVTDHPIGSVTAIHLHPIKSCHRIDVEVATVSPTGLEGDRQWQVSAGMKPMTQRQKSVLATVHPELIDGGLRISAPRQPTIEVATPEVADAVTGTLVGMKVDVGDGGDEAAAWFSRLLDEDVRLYGRTSESRLQLPPDLDPFDQELAFGDLAPVLVTNTASLRWLQDHAIEPFDMARFRPNLVVETPDPWAEDTWARFTLGPCHLRYGLAWPRCAVPQVDQETGERRREPAVALRAHRFLSSAPALPDPLRSLMEGNALFGIGCSIGPVGSEIGLGDPVVVTETMEPLLPAPTGA